MNRFLMTTTCVLACMAAPAVAQESATTGPDASINAPNQSNPQAGAPAPGQRPSPEAATQDQGGLQDIIVTAQRREESLQRAAIAVTAVTGDLLRNAGISRPTELTAVVPALQVATSAGPYNLFYLRGVGNFNGNALSDSAIAFNYNGVYIGRPSSVTGFFYDLERLEVLKGPQGTLYGRNATGGAINVITHRPELGEFGGNLSGEYGNYDSVRVDGALNVPIGDNAAVRAAGVYVRHDGYMSDGSDGQKDYGGRLSFRWEPSADWSVALYGDYFNQGGSGPGSTVIALGPDRRLGLRSPEVEAFYQTQPVAIAGRTFNPVTTVPNLHNQFWGVHSVIEHRSSIGTITLIPAYRGAKIDYITSTPGFQIAQRENDRQYSFEGRLASDDTAPLRYLAGLFFYNETNDIPRYFVNSQYNGSFQNYKADSTSLAIFGRLTYAFTPEFRATVGGRYTTEDKKFSGRYFSMNRLCLNFPAFQAGQGVQVSGPCPGAAPLPYNATTPPAATIPFNPAFPFVGFNEIYGDTAIFQTATVLDVNRRASFQRFTWRAGLDWDITPQNLLYGSYETGFKSGGFFFSSDSGIFRPEKIQAWTLGSKNRFFNNRVQLNAELFYWKYRDQQISHLGQDSQGNIIFPTENVGRATFKGGEIEAQFLVTETTLLNADVQYLDAKYNNFLYNVPNQGPAFSGCTTVGTPTNVITLDCSGFRPPNAPKWTLNLGAQQTIPFANGGKVVLNGRAHYQSDTLTGLEFLPIEVQKNYWTLDASVTYNAPGDRFFVAGFVNNATDKTVIGNTFPPPLSKFVVGSLRPPRTYGIRAGVKF